MTSSNTHQELFRLAQAYAERPDIVQAAGGNFSVKIDSERMLIKASGRAFKDITKEGDGIVEVSYPALALSVQDGALSNDEAVQLNLIKNSVATSKTERPSMETWFHTFLPSWVLHTHSVYVNILSCSEEGPLLFTKLMEKKGINAFSLSYYAPGFALGHALKDALPRNTPKIIFLVNHGIIVSGESADECLVLHQEVEDAIRSALKVGLFEIAPLNNEEKEEFNQYLLFPDQAIYPQHPMIRSAHRFIMKHIRENGLTPRGLAPQEVQKLVSMDSEKHRKSLSQY